MFALMIVINQIRAITRIAPTERWGVRGTDNTGLRIDDLRRIREYILGNPARWGDENHPLRLDSSRAKIAGNPWGT